jgi:hypothetical protein
VECKLLQRQNAIAVLVQLLEKLLRVVGLCGLRLKFKGTRSKIRVPITARSWVLTFPEVVEHVGLWKE